MLGNTFGPLPVLAKHQQELGGLTYNIAKDLAKRLGSPEVVFHYTDSKALLGILGDELRATHIGFMEDGSKYLHGVNLLTTAIEVMHKKMPPGPRKQFAAHVIQQLELTSIENMPTLFVACFTSAEDSYPHWKNYGRAEGGFSIGFDTLQLAKQVTATGHGMFAPVVYKERHQRELVGLIANLLFETWEKHIAEIPVQQQQAYSAAWLESFFAYFSGFAAITKGQNFVDEAEHRLVFSTHGTVDQIIFDPKPHVLSGYVAPQLGKLPIHSVRVGPGTYQRNNVTALKGYFLQKGIKEDDIRIRVSSHRKIT
jgi:Protein of unknown function (DUF2971).